MSNTISVLLADDHAILRRALRLTVDDEPDLKVVGEAADGAEAVRLALLLRPQVIVMDLTMPIMDGIQATAEIKKQAPEIAVVVLTMHTEETLLRKAVAAGAQSYVFKSAGDLDLISAIRSAGACCRQDSTRAAL